MVLSVILTNFEVSYSSIINNKLLFTFLTLIMCMCICEQNFFTTSILAYLSALNFAKGIGNQC